MDEKIRLQDRVKGKRVFVNRIGTVIAIEKRLLTTKLPKKLGIGDWVTVRWDDPPTLNMMPEDHFEIVERANFEENAN